MGRHAIFRFDPHNRPDGIPVRASALEFDHERVAPTGRIVSEGQQLGPKPILEEQVGPTVAIEVRDRETAAVNGSVESRDSGQIAVAPAATGEEDIGFVAVPIEALPDQLVQAVPACLVQGRRRGVRRRLGYHSAPEETVEVPVGSVRHHAGGNQDLRRPIQIEIETVPSPRPAPHLDALQVAHGFKRSSSGVPVQGVSFRVAAVSRRGGPAPDGPEGGVPGDPLAGRRPHVGHIEIQMAVPIEVEPGGTHARARVLHASFRGDVPESAVRELVQIVAAEIVGDIEFRPTVLVIIAPSCGEAVAVVVLV